VPFPDGFFDAVVLFTVLTCIPGDHDQRAVIDEVHRLTQLGGLLYTSDMWLQTDERNRQRYAQFENRLPYGLFGSLKRVGSLLCP